MKNNARAWLCKILLFLVPVAQRFLAFFLAALLLIFLPVILPYIPGGDQIIEAWIAFNAGNHKIFVEKMHEIREIFGISWVRKWVPTIE